VNAARMRDASVSCKPLSSELSTCKTAKARFWPWLEPFFRRKSFNLVCYERGTPAAVSYERRTPVSTLLRYTSAFPEMSMSPRGCPTGVPRS